jgi:EmrB/QacA subfamily drug resistance transporter
MRRTRPAPDAQRGTAPADPRGALVAVSLALFCIQLDFFALNLALPAISTTFGVSEQAVQWTLSAYMLTLGSLFIVGGRLGDILGRRRLLLLGTAVFGLASAGAALAGSLEVLVGFRVLQGVGAAVMFPVGIAVISNAYPPDGRAKALGLGFAVANIGTALGPFVGGGLAQGPGWRWIFWLLVPLCAASVLVGLRYVPDSSDPAASRRVDLLGAGLVALGVAAIGLGVDLADTAGLLSVAAVGPVVLGVGALVVFCLHESRTPAPLIDLALFRNPPFDLVTALGAVANIAFGVTVFISSLYLQVVRGLTPLTAGLVFLAPSVLVASAGPIGARLQSRFRPTLVMAGAGVLSGVAIALLSLVTPWWLYVPVFAVCGLGLGLGWTFANMATQEVVPSERAGEASGVVLTILVTTGGIGLAASSSLVSALERSGHDAAQAFATTLQVVAVACLAAAVVALLVRAVLVRRGLVAPLDMTVPWPAAAQQETA